MKKTTFLSLLCASVFLLSTFSFAHSHAPRKKPAVQKPPAIILASFGTTIPEAIPAITNILDKVRKANPNSEVRLCFTSNIIRKIWRKRQQNPEKWLKLGVPKEILYSKNILSSFGDLYDAGHKNIIVQPSHMFFMEQSYDLKQYTDAIASIETKKAHWKPFQNIVLGRPALGNPKSSFDYRLDIERVAQSFAKDIEIAKSKNAVLVYMGHGNEHWTTSIYKQLEVKMNTLYRGTKTFIAVVEGQPDLNSLIARLPKDSKILLKPLMIVAGDHARNDMASEEEDSWKSILTKKGFQVETVLEGLGENDSFANIFVEHIADAKKMLFAKK